MFALVDRFNKQIVSRHRTIDAAVRADRKIQSGLRGGSYLPTVVKRIVSGSLVDLSDSETEEVLFLYDYHHGR